VFVYSELVFEFTDVMLSMNDLWDVGTIHWPSGECTPRVDCDSYCVYQFPLGPDVPMK
jgi:hypothetical protein